MIHKAFNQVLDLPWDHLGIIRMFVLFKSPSVQHQVSHRRSKGYPICRMSNHQGRLSNLSCTSVELFLHVPAHGGIAALQAEVDMMQ